MKKILIIEDQRMLREEVSDWFEFEGFKIFSAANGREGVELAVKHLPDLILCDIMMPEMDGNEVLEILRNNPVTSLIPFIFMTALAERRQVRTGMEQGADDYITKPFTRAELLDAVAARLEKSDEIRERSGADLEELRNNLITGLPHELRTPLNGMLGFGQMLKNYPESFSPEELPEIGNRIYDSAVRLFRLIQNYLLYAQLELKRSGRSQKFELERAGEIAIRTIRNVAEKYKRENDLIINEGKGVVFAPELEFSKIIEEISDNAFRFSSPGQKVVLSFGTKDQYFTIIIRDYGCGISAENLRKIGAFMQFERKLREQQGSGLGLIISERIAELFDGTLTVESEYGKGTSVVVKIPGR